MLHSSMNIRCLSVGEDEIPVLWEPTIPLMALTTPFGPDRCPHTHWLPSEIKIFFKFSPNVQIISSAAFAQSANHLTFYICQRSTLPSS